MKNFVKAPILLLLIVCVRSIFSDFPGSTRDCSGGTQSGLVNVNVCSFDCGADCCGILGGSNTLCQTQLENIGNNVTLPQLIGLCGLGSNGGSSCSADAFRQGDACLLNIDNVKQLASVCNLAVLGTAGALSACMVTNNITANQVVSCCSSNGSGGVTCTGQNFCSNTANYDDYYDYSNCCTVACGVYSG